MKSIKKKTHHNSFSSCSYNFRWEWVVGCSKLLPTKLTSFSWSWGSAIQLITVTMCGLKISSSYLKLQFIEERCLEVGIWGRNWSNIKNSTLISWKFLLLGYTVASLMTAYNLFPINRGQLLLFTRTFCVWHHRYV